MTIAYVKKVRGLFSSTPVDFAFSGNVTQDNYIIVSAAIYLNTGASPALGIATKAGSTATLGSWVQAKSAELAVSADRLVTTIYHAKVTVTGSLTLQLNETVAGGNGGTAVAVEYSGIDLTTPLDGATSQGINTGSPTIQTCGSISPTTAGMICSISGDYTTSGTVARSAITDTEDDREDNSANVTYFVQHKVTASGGTSELSNTVAVGMEYVGVSVAYQAASGTADTPPTVDSFIIPSTSSALSFPVSAFTASDNNAVTGYLITDTATAPDAADSRWLPSAPDRASVSSPGSQTAYAWAKDAAGNVSTAATATITVTLPAIHAYYNVLGNGMVNSALLTRGSIDPVSLALKAFLFPAATGGAPSETLASSIAAITSLTDNQGMIEAAAVLISAGISVTDTRQMVEALLDSATATTGVTDLIVRIETLLETIQAVSSITDARQMVETLIESASGIITVIDAATFADSVTATATATTALADVKAQVETLLESATGITTLTDARQMVESLLESISGIATLTDTSTLAETVLTSITATTSATDAQQQVEQLLTTAAATISATDTYTGSAPQNYSETLLETISAAISAGDSMAAVDLLQSAAQGITSISDAVSVIETLLTVATVTTTIVDTKLSGMSESLTTAIAASTSLVDLQIMVDNVTVLAQAGSTASAIAAFLEQLTETVTAQSQTTEAFFKALTSSIMLGFTVAPRTIKTVVTVRHTTQLVRQRSFTTQGHARC